MRSPLGMLLVAVVGTACLSTTASRVDRWRGGNLALWQDATVTSPAKPRPWVNLGREYAITRDLEPAAAAYEAAIRTASVPTRGRDERLNARAIAEANLGVLRYQQGRPDDGAALITAAHDRVVTDPNIARVFSWMTDLQAPAGSR